MESKEIVINELVLMNPYIVFSLNNISDVLEKVAVTYDVDYLFREVDDLVRFLIEWANGNKDIPNSRLARAFMKIFEPYAYRQARAIKHVSSQLRSIFNQSLLIHKEYVEEIAIIASLFGLASIHSDNNDISLGRSYIFKASNQDINTIEETARIICFLENCKISFDPIVDEPFLTYISTSLAVSLSSQLQKARMEVALFDDDFAIYKSFRFSESLRGLSSLGNVLLPEDVEHLAGAIDLITLRANVFNRSQVHLAEIVNRVERYLTKAISCFPYTRVKIKDLGYSAQEYNYLSGATAIVFHPIPFGNRIQILSSDEVIGNRNNYLVMRPQVQDVNYDLQSLILDGINHVKLKSQSAYGYNYFVPRVDGQRFDYSDLVKLDFLGKVHNEYDALFCLSKDITSKCMSPLNIGHASFIDSIRIYLVEEKPNDDLGKDQRWEATYHLEARLKDAISGLEVGFPLSVYEHNGRHALYISYLDLASFRPLVKSTTKEFLVFKNKVNYMAIVKMDEFTDELLIKPRFFIYDTHGISIKKLELRTEQLKRLFGVKFNDLGLVYSRRKIFTHEDAVESLKKLCKSISEEHLLNLVRDSLTRLDPRSIHIKSYALKSFLQVYVEEISSRQDSHSLQDKDFQIIKELVRKDDITYFLITVSYMYVAKELWERYSFLPSELLQHLYRKPKLREKFVDLLSKYIHVT